MTKKLSLALVAVLVVAGFTASSSPALASESLRSAPTYEATYEQPTWVNPTAHASCPVCVFAAGAAVRAAIAIRAARAARAVIIAARAARAAAKTAAKVTRAKVRRIQAEARVISRRSARWVKKKWPTFKFETKVCLSTIAFMKGGGMLKDRILDRDEWSRYSSFGPRLVPATETLSINFPIRFSARELAGKGAEEAIACAVSVGFARYYGKGNNGPHPE